MDKKWIKTQFQIDGDEKLFNGWTQGEHWNGWACPRFDKETAESVAKTFGEKFEWRGETLRVEMAEQWEEFEPVEGPEGFPLWPVGAWAWCWDDVREWYDVIGDPTDEATADEAEAFPHLYCAICDRPAVNGYTAENGAIMALCAACGEAFEMGQANGEATLEPIEDIVSPSWPRFDE